MNLEKIHVIGFSLGAEVAGFIGKILKAWGLFLPRITGERKYNITLKLLKRNTEQYTQIIILIVPRKS